jgi:hypothetical protein
MSHLDKYKGKTNQYNINKHNNNQNLGFSDKRNINVNQEDQNFLTFSKKDEITKSEPSYIMTIELEKGKSDIIKIYSDSTSEELAFEFCKKNNLNLKAMQFLSSEIGKLLSKMTIQSKP